MMTLNSAQQKEPNEFHSPLQGTATVLVTVLRSVYLGFVNTDWNIRLREPRVR